MFYLFVLLCGLFGGFSSASDPFGCVPGDFHVAYDLRTNDLSSYYFSQIYFLSSLVKQINSDPSLVFHQNNWQLGYVIIPLSSSIKSFHSFSQLRPAWSPVYRSLLESNFTFCNIMPKEDGRRHLYYVQGAVTNKGSSTVSLISSYLQHNGIPLIGTYSSAQDLGDKEKHPYFARMVPGDSYQAQVVVELVLRFRWRYLMVIHDSGAYGSGLARDFASLLRKNTKHLPDSYCITMQRPYDSGSYDVTTIVTEIEKNINKTNIVIFFNFWYSNLMTALARFQLVYVFTDGVGSPKSNSINQTLGSFFIGFTSSTTEHSFVSDFNALSNSTIANIPFGKEYWEKMFNCCFENCNTTCSMFPTLNASMKLTNSSRFYSRTGLSIITLARAMSDVAFGPECGSFTSNKNLSGLTQCMTGSLIQAALLKQNFSRFKLPVSFLVNGDARPQYRLRQQTNRTDQVEMRDVGAWDYREGLQLNTQLLSWRTGAKPEAFCSAPCLPGEYKRLVDSECCWVCERCRDNEIESNKSCLACPMHFWPSNGTCLPLKPEFSSWNESPAFINFALACLGMSLVLVTIAIYIVKKNEPLLKASAIELSLMVLSGLMLSYMTILTSFHGYPTALSCMVRLLGYGVSLSLSYSCLLVKTIRIFRVFASATKGTARPRFVSTHSVLFAASILWICQVSLDIYASSFLDNWRVGI